MRSIPLHESLFHGAVSLERMEDGVKPWRIPYRQLPLFPPDGLNGKAEIPAGVRLRFESDTGSVRIRIRPSEQDVQTDCVVDGEQVHTAVVSAGEEWMSFEHLGRDMKLVEIYLSQRLPTVVAELLIDPDAACSVSDDRRPKWIAYGSSITQCVEAASPSQTWPALAARALGFNLTCLGFAANCHMEPMVARMIRDMPADLISLCFGINMMGGSSYSARTFKAGVIGFVETVREKHAGIPIYVQSPIYCASRETTENKVDMTLVRMREHIREAVEAIRSCGGDRVHYADGLELFGESYASYMPDGLHPNADGYRIMADRFPRIVMGGQRQY